MRSTRRSFLALAASSAAGAFASRAVEPVRIALLSDIHVSKVKFQAVFRDSLKTLASRNPDAVLSAGDLIDNAVESQLKLVADAWYDVFPGDKAPDGRHVEKIFVNGNHDLEGHTYGNFIKQFGEERTKAELVGPRLPEVWKRLFKIDWAPIRIVDVKGWKFVCVDWGYDTKENLESFFSVHGKMLSEQKVFFYVQHKHPQGTCNSPLKAPSASAVSTQILSRFPNCIAFSGHSHCSIHDERAIWQGTFTSIGLSTLASPKLAGGRENTTRGHLTDIGDEQMFALYTRACKQGMVMEIYPDRVVLERLELKKDRKLAADWVLPIPPDGARPYSYAKRMETERVPQFPKGAKVSVEAVKGQNRAKEPVDQLMVRFPNVFAADGARPLDFEVQLELKDVDVFKIEKTKRVYSKWCCSTEDADVKIVECAYAFHEVPAKIPYRFLVRPCGFFGAKGNPIFSRWYSRDPQVVRYDRTLILQDPVIER